MSPHLKYSLCFIIAILIVIIMPLSVFAWGPEREVFTIENPAPYVVFNSITNNPNYGDERNFLNVSEYDTQTQRAISNNDNSPAMWGDVVTVENDKEYIVRLYVHNNAAGNLDLKAHNVLATIDLPSYEGKSIRMDGYLSWDNIDNNVNKIWDQVGFNSDTFFTLSLVSGSVKYTSNAFPNGLALSDSIIGSSVAISDGYDDNGNIDAVLDGEVHGCFRYDGWLSFRVKAHTTDFAISATARLHNEKIDRNLKDEISVARDEIVDFQIYFRNTGSTILEDVVIENKLPDFLEYIPHSTKLKTDNGVKSVADGITTVGLEIGNYLPNGEAYLAFSAKVLAEDISNEFTFLNVATAITKIGAKTDSVAITTFPSLFFLTLNRLNQSPAWLDITLALIALLVPVVLSGKNTVKRREDESGIEIAQRALLILLIVILLYWIGQWIFYYFKLDGLIKFTVLILAVYALLYLLIYHRKAIKDIFSKLLRNFLS